MKRVKRVEGDVEITWPGDAQVEYCFLLSIPMGSSDNLI